MTNPPRPIPVEPLPVEPILAEPVDDSPAPPAMLGYRALRFVWRTGAAPRAMDALLLLATGLGVAAVFALIIVALDHDGTWVAAALLPVPLGWIGGLWYWSNHFRHRVPTAAEDLTAQERELDRRGPDWP